MTTNGGYMMCIVGLAKAVQCECYTARLRLFFKQFAFKHLAWTIKQRALSTKSLHRSRL